MLAAGVVVMLYRVRLRCGGSVACYAIGSLPERPHPTHKCEYQQRGHGWSAHCDGPDSNVRIFHDRVAENRPSACDRSHRGVVALFPQNRFQGLAQIGIPEGISAGHELIRFDPLAREQNLFGHLSEGKVGGEGRNRKYRRTR